MATASVPRHRALSLVGLLLAILAALLAFVLSGGERANLACAPIAPQTAETPSAVPAEPKLDRVALAEPPVEAELPKPEAVRAVVERASATVSGRVLDRATNEPVPFVEVLLACGGVSARASTDAAGAFASSVEFPSGRLSAGVVDDGVPVERFDTQFDAALGMREWLLDVPIGPTYPISAIDGALVDAGAWTAELFESTLDDETAGEIDVRPDALEVFAPPPRTPDRAWSPRTMRMAAVPFVRWPKREHEPDRRYRATLVLRSKTLFARAETRVLSTVGVQRALAPSSEPRATVVGEFDRRGRPNGGVALPLRVVLFQARVGGERSAGSSTVLEVNGSAAGFAFDDVPPGNWSIVAWGPNASSARGNVRVTRGDLYHVKSMPLDVADDARARAAAERAGAGSEPLFDGVNTSQLLLLAPSRAHGATRALVARVDRLAQDFYAMQDHARGRLDLRGVGIGEGSALGTSQRNVGKIAGRVDEIDFDPSRRERCRIDVYRGAAEARIGGAVAFGPAGSMFTLRELDGDGSFTLARNGEVRWSAWAGGCAPRFGDERDLRAIDPRIANGASKAAEVRLQPGWGAQLLLRRGDPTEIEADPWPWRAGGGVNDRAVLAALAAPPVPGVRCQVDGFGDAASDENGEVQLTTSAMPVRLTLRAEGWRLVALDALEGPGVRYVVWLKPLR